MSRPSLQISSKWMISVLSAAAVPLSLSAADRLPQSESSFKGKIGFSVKDSIPDWPEPINAPKDAPNIVLILLDDAGYADSELFGGPASTPALKSLAAQGLKYNRFHVAALCSPTRASLLSGRNEHRVGFGTISQAARGFPGYDGVWKKSTASVAEILKRNGYSTAAFGKWHNTPWAEITPIGPFDRWPTGLGFEYFYGMMSGADSQWEPVLHRNTTLVDPPATPEQGYHFTADIVDDAIRWVRTQESLAPEKPYFLYLATGATHNPHHVPKEWIEKYRGQFDQGWDRLREEIFARQKKLGVIPANTQLTPRPKELPAWNWLPSDQRRLLPKELPAWSSLSAEQRKLLSRQMEVYAAFVSHTDHEIGRLLREVQQGPEGNNTLILYITGDNGGDVLSGMAGAEPPALSEQLRGMEELGSPATFNYFASGWAWATNTPFQWGKTFASHFGGTRNAMIVSWPARIKDRGGLRAQFTHVNDVAATLYDLIGIDFPKAVDGVEQVPLDGTSFAYSFDDASAPSRHRTQIFEQLGNRAIYHEGWVASARHTAPRHGASSAEDYAQDRWELYHVDEDFSQARDLAARHPEKLRELQALFDVEARNKDVYPLGGWDHPWLQEPSLTRGKDTFVYRQGQPPIQVEGMTVPNFAQSHRITASVVIPDQGAQGVLVSNGGRMGGFVLYVKDDRIVYETVNARRSGSPEGSNDVLISSMPLPRGRVELTYEYSKGDPVSAAGGTGRLYINGHLAGQMILPTFSPGSRGTFNVGEARLSPVSRAYSMPFRFTGALDWVKVELR